MAWEALKQIDHSRTVKNFVTIRPKRKRMYLSAQLIRDYLKDCPYVNVRVNKETSMIAIQPAYRKGEGIFKITKFKRGGIEGGGEVHTKKLFQYKFVPQKKNKTFKPHWNPQMEWLTINLNGDNEKGK